MPKNPLLVIAFAAIIALCIYRLARMLIRKEALVREGWTKWTWEPADLYRWMYVYGLVIHVLMIGMASFFIYADFKGWTR